MSDEPKPHEAIEKGEDGQYRIIPAYRSFEDDGARWAEIGTETPRMPTIRTGYCGRSKSPCRRNLIRQSVAPGSRGIAYA